MVELEGLFHSSFSLQSQCVQTDDSGKLVLLDWESQGHEVVRMTKLQVLQFSGNKSFDHETTQERQRSSLFFPEQKRLLQPAPSTLSEPCPAKRTSLRAAISMSSQASSLATSAEHRLGRSLESCMVQTFYIKYKHVCYYTMLLHYTITQFRHTLSV